jgi:PhnB protein
MGSDAAGCMGEALVTGNNVNLNLETDSRAQSDALFAALAVGGKVSMPMQDMFWGAYFGSVTDRFGICWMINCESRQ